MTVFKRRDRFSDLFHFKLLFLSLKFDGLQLPFTILVVLVVQVIEKLFSTHSFEIGFLLSGFEVSCLDCFFLSFFLFERTIEIFGSNLQCLRNFLILFKKGVGMLVCQATGPAYEVWWFLYSFWFFFLFFDFIKKLFCIKYRSRLLVITLDYTARHVYLFYQLRIDFIRKFINLIHIIWFLKQPQQLNHLSISCPINIVLTFIKDFFPPQQLLFSKLCLKLKFFFSITIKLLLSNNKWVLFEIKLKFLAKVGDIFFCLFFIFLDDSLKCGQPEIGVFVRGFDLKSAIFNSGFDIDQRTWHEFCYLTQVITLDI